LFLRGLVVTTFTMFTAESLFATCRIVTDPIFETVSGRGHFRSVLRGGLFGLVETERAAFIVDHGDGSFESVAWPASQATHAETFHGQIPAGTKAIVHTHPARWPRPSPQDRMEAVRLGIPIYVLTPRATYGTERSDVAAVVLDQNWFANAFDSRPAHCQ
jgi:hypothetical protein